MLFRSTPVRKILEDVDKAVQMELDKFDEAQKQKERIRIEKLDPRAEFEYQRVLSESTIKPIGLTLPNPNPHPVRQEWETFRAEAGHFRYLSHYSFEANNGRITFESWNVNDHE